MKIHKPDERHSSNYPSSVRVQKADPIAYLGVDNDGDWHSVELTENPKGFIQVRLVQ